ncbi:MAG TPA: NAD(P)/FAD-dependent oxidoreductase [Thermoanaerobaculia bacterium]|nr:NAD(P)/FAD-dependent oxidoreductase [Thermoanaerobaculia bacterium]
MATRRFDLVVIGSGSAASAVATRCRKAGWSAAVIDELPFGGTCALRGCDPKKVLVGNAEAIEWARRLKGKGIRSEGLRIDWPELMRFKRLMIAGVPEGTEEGFRNAGIEVFHGQARFTGPTTLEVAGQCLEGKRVVIASGAKPAPLGIAGEELLTTSTQFLELDELPRRIVFVGGGFISFEFAHVAIRAGATVTILHRGPRPLSLFDPDLVNQLVEKSRILGIDLQMDTSVTRIERLDRGFVIRGRHEEKETRVEADLVVHGAGRVPAVDDLDLHAAGIDAAGRRIKLNEFLQSQSNPAVYVAGDATAAGPALTPVAGYEGRVVAANLLEGNHVRADYSVVPSVAFTIPPLAAVGLTEDAARRGGLHFRTNLLDTSSWYSSSRVGETHSGSKVLIDEESGRILGAHLLGPSAEEMINLFAMAMRTGMTSPQIKEMLFAYPTHGSDMAYMV